LAYGVTLPIPTLDGGHLAFYMAEGVRGRPLAEKIQEIGFQIGLFMIISLMVFTLYNDVKQLLL
jgi:regulator of sigma E protease